jgi:hypothetical protein
MISRPVGVSMKRCVLALILVVASTGCAFTKVETGRQLDRGDIVVSGTLDWPGLFFVLPRGQINGMYGYGPGDVSLHVGSALAMYNFGVGTRFYPHEIVTLSLQSDLNFAGLGSGAYGGPSGSRVGFWTITPRVLTSTAQYRPIYAGAQSILISRVVQEPGVGTSRSPFAVTLGGVIGMEVIQPTTGFGFQAEVNLMPFSITSEGLRGGLPRSLELGTVPILGQFSLGVAYHHRRGAEIEPTEVPHTPEPEPVREPVVEPEPERDYDEQDVPVY